MDSKTRNPEKMRPDYKRIYLDILEKIFPEKISDCRSLLEKEHLGVVDIQELNKMIFGISDKAIARENRKYCSYSQSDILHMLDYQKKNRLNNIELARHFKLSRNTVAKWKKIFM